MKNKKNEVYVTVDSPKVAKKLKKVLNVINKLAVIAAFFSGFISLFQGDKVEGLLLLIFGYQMMIFDRQDKGCDVTLDIKGNDNILKVVDRESKR